MSKEKILVTGATGFIGRALCQKLFDSGHTVIGSSRTEAPGSWQSFRSMDLSVTQSHLNLEGIGTVYHLASKAHALSEKPGDISGYREVIVEGTRRLVEVAERDKVERFIFMSSVKAMGEGLRFDQRAPINENADKKPSSPYGQAKLEAERIVLASSIPHVVILRPVMVYGPGHKGNLVRMANAIKAKRFPPIRENGNRRSMLHVQDLVEACIAATSKDNANREAFIVAGSQSYSTRQLYDQLRSEMGLGPIKWHMPNAALYAAAKAGGLLGGLFRRRMPIDSDTLRKLIGSAWYDNTKSQRILGLSYQNESHLLLEG
jgi:UDP-glucose 4-epimerase